MSSSNVIRMAISILGIYLGSVGTALAQSASISDSTFADANWTLSVFPAGNGGSVTANQTTIGGNPLRSVSDTVNTTLSTILGVHIYTPFTYQPAVSGAIASLNYSESAICLAGCFGQGQSTGPAVLQGGVLYGYNGFLITGPGTSFQTLSLSALTATDFSRVAVTTTTLFDDTQHPNFSAGGAPIQFGFFRANGSGPSTGYTLVGGIDDWQIAVVTGVSAAPAIIPTLDPTAMAALALILAISAALLLRRRV
jgi:hypothetical protein